MPRKTSTILNFIARVLIAFISIFSNCKCHSQCCECDMDNNPQTPQPSPMPERKKPEIKIENEDQNNLKVVEI